MAKYYAIAKGKSGVPMILESWDSCKEEVIGFKGSIYKSFGNRQDAVDFIRLHGISFEGESQEKQDTEEVLSIYVDGSFMPQKNNYSFGLVAVDNGEVVYKDNGIGYDEEAIALRNVSGNVLKVIEYTNRIKKISV